MLDAHIVVLHLASQLESLGEEFFQTNGYAGALVRPGNAGQLFYLGFYLTQNGVGVDFGELQHSFGQAVFVRKKGGEKMQYGSLGIVAGQSLIPRLHQGRLDLFCHFLNVHIFSSYG